MKFLDIVKSRVQDSEIIEQTENFLFDAVDALLGDPVAAGKIVYSLGRNAFLFRERLFWTKVEVFLSGIDTREGERAKFCEELEKYAANKEGAFRLVQIIDRADTETKIKYITNAAHAVANNYIDLSSFFRIIHAVASTLNEDLKFLGEHIKDKSEFVYNDNVQGLQNNGLMYQSLTDEENSRFKFTPLAEDLDEYAINFDNVERYPRIGKPSSTRARNISPKAVANAVWGAF